MPKALATLITFAALVSAVAHAPGVPFGKSERPLSAGADVNDAQPAIDQGAWLDTALSDAQIRIASWHHTWTDTEAAPETYFETPEPKHYEPQGVLLAQAPEHSSADSSGLNVFGPRFDFRGSAHGSGSKSKPSGNQDDGSTGSELPATDGVTETSPGDETGTDTGTDTDETNSEEGSEPSVDQAPAQVPEPMTMSLLGLGLAGMLMFGRRRIVRSAC